ncbi:MAG: AraC family transcriptional regulator [Dehalococcoidales bacterium]|nr:AraC family transcriptional regulator [Dehalococcoidales bacterium]
MADVVQQVMDIIDSRITENISLDELAEATGYSTFHLNRIFAKEAGITLMAYATRRKLQYALFDLGCGEKILDVAVKYGFETHAGFTKAFRKCFGSPPSVFRTHAIISRPAGMEAGELKRMLSGGITMYPEIIEKQPFTIVGFTSRHKIPGARFTHDVPYYVETSGMNYWDPLTRLHNRFTRSRHTEYTVCFDIDEEKDEITYLLAVGVDNPEDLAKIEPDMYRMDIPGGLYAKFTTGMVQGDTYMEFIRELWKKAFENWLPSSDYEFDDTRYDYEYYDERDHFYHDRDLGGMDIFIPIKKR